jgi:hypothetical protein
MSFDSLLQDKITLVKKDGKRFESIRASVQRDKIFTNDPAIPIEDGDVFERTLPSGIVEYYTILDAGFRQGTGGIRPHYQSVVRKQTKTDPSAQPSQITGRNMNTDFEWDVFVSHASEDKDSFVRELAQELGRKGVRVWYDEFTLSVGDSLRQSIDKGLAKSRYGIVILSHNFFVKDWPQKELDGLVVRERNGQKVFCQFGLMLILIT